MPGVYITIRDRSIQHPLSNPAGILVGTNTASPSSEPTPSIVTSGLKVYYDLSSSLSYPGSGANLFDLSGNDSDATISGLTFDSGYSGSLVFPGTPDPGNVAGIELTDGGTSGVNPWMDSNPTLTLSFWLKIDAVGKSHTIFGSGGDVAVTAGRLTFQAQSAGVTTGYFRVQKGAVSTTADFNADYTYNSDTPLNVVLTKTGFTYELYVNGELKGTVVDGTSTTYNTDYNILGTNWNPGASIGQRAVDKFKGNLYVFMAYDRVLTSSEILQNFNTHKSRFGL